MLHIRVVQCLCTQCEGELLHLYEVCLPVISVEHMSQVQVWVVGPGFVSTSPDRARSPASHMRGSMGRLTEKTVEYGPSLEGQGLNGADLAVLVIPFLDGSSNRVEASTNLEGQLVIRRSIVFATVDVRDISL